MFTDAKKLVLDGKKLIGHILVLLMAALILGFFSYFWWDQSLALFFRRDENMNLWVFAREITDIGLGQHYFIFVALFLIYLYYYIPRFRQGFDPIRSYWLKAWTWSFLAALLCAGFLLRLGKFIFGRQRPHISLDSAPNTFEFFNHNWDFQSFPSGHTQVLFTVATMLAILDPKRKFLWFLLAFGLSFTRVMTYSHFLSDIIAGAFIGISGSLVGLYLMNRYSRFQVFKN